MKTSTKILNVLQLNCLKTIFQKEKSWKKFPKKSPSIAQRARENPIKKDSDKKMSGEQS